MLKRRPQSLILLLIITNLCFAKIQPAMTQPVPIDELVDYQHYPPQVKQLIDASLSLSQQNLTYIYGSSDPKNGGMDCSGTIYYLLKKAKVNDPPRSSNDMFNWAEKKGHLYRVQKNDLNSTDFDHLKPGDLLFWSGTYNTSNSISHVMLYLGKTKAGKPLMFGSSDGRFYQNKKMWGVSVFNFDLPNEKVKAKFVGYSCIPQVTC